MSFRMCKIRRLGRKTWSPPFRGRSVELRHPCRIIHARTVIRWAVFEDGIRFIGVGKNGGWAGGGVLQGLCCCIESGTADVADRTFVGTGVG